MPAAVSPNGVGPRTPARSEQAYLALSFWVAVPRGKVKAVVAGADPASSRFVRSPPRGALHSRPQNQVGGRV
jgi:hypothetical protein